MEYMSVVVTVQSTENGTYHFRSASVFCLLFHAMFNCSFYILTVLTAHSRFGRNGSLTEQHQEETRGSGGRQVDFDQWVSICLNK